MIIDVGVENSKPEFEILNQRKTLTKAKKGRIREICCPWRKRSKGGWTDSSLEDQTKKAAKGEQLRRKEKAEKEKGRNRYITRKKKVGKKIGA